MVVDNISRLIGGTMPQIVKEWIEVMSKAREMFDKMTDEEALEANTWLDEQAGL
jgi:hypothetical protein